MKNRKPLVLTIFEGKGEGKGRWYWHGAKGGKITADGSEGYSTASNSRKGLRGFAADLIMEVLQANFPTVTEPVYAPVRKVVEHLVAKLPVERT